MFGPFNEEWKDVPGFEDLYKISTYGRLFLKSREIVEISSRYTKPRIWRTLERLAERRLTKKGYILPKVFPEVMPFIF